MQTFLPYPDFVSCAGVLDSRRLGKQRVEALQILRALELPEYGWSNHPAVRMWRGRTPALVVYALSCVHAWGRRGFADSTAAQITEFAPSAEHMTQPDLAAAGMLPSWLGDQRLHRSHRSKLLAKDPQRYGSLFTDVPADLDYFWPQGDDVPAAAEPAPGRRLWVVRPESQLALGQFITAGAVGLGTASGIDQDAHGLTLAELRGLLGGTRRRPSRALVALAALVSEINEQDQVAVLVERDRSLLIGRVVGDYQFDPSDAVGLAHRRPVAWQRVVPRAAVIPSSALQDVRPLFTVALDPAVDLDDQRPS